MESIPLKKRRGRKPNALKHLTEKLPERDRRKDILKSPNHHKNKKSKCSKIRRKSKVSTSRYEKEGYEAEVQVLESRVNSGPATKNGNVYCEMTALATSKELKSSDLSEMSLLSDITIDSIMDLSGPVGITHSTPKTVPPAVLFQDCPLNNISLESYLLSPDLTPNTSICCDNTQPLDLEEHASSCVVHTNEITGDEDRTQYSNNAGENDPTPTCKELCEEVLFTDYENAFLPPSSPNISDDDLWSSKENFKTVGLTNVNLEELAETSSMILSVDNTMSDRSQEKKAKCKDFQKAMKGNDKNKTSKRRYKEPQSNSYNLVSFNTDIIASELDFITDFIYCKYECPALIQKFLQHNYWENRLLREAEVAPPTPCTSDRIEATHHKQYRAQLARKMAGCGSKSNPLKKKSCTYDNPPVEEISRTLKTPHAVKLHSSPSAKAHPLIHWQDQRNVSNFQDRSMNRDKEKTVGRLNVFKRLNSCDLEKIESDGIDEFQVIKVEDRQDNKWLTLSEWWLSKDLDVSEMLKLLD